MPCQHQHHRLVRRAIRPPRALTPHRLRGSQGGSNLHAAARITRYLHRVTALRQHAPRFNATRTANATATATASTVTPTAITARTHRPLRAPLRPARADATAHVRTPGWPCEDTTASIAPIAAITAIDATR